ncbi:LOW QUALITY PROTEIN: outer dynein arm-docking complex subunit 2-like [Anableps anableps]
MGLTLTRAAQWTTSTSGTDKLESTPLNQSLLEETLDLVEKFGSKYPQEAEHVFEEPLQWNTTLVASDFKEGYDIRDSAVESLEKDSEGQPLLQLSPPSVSVRSFSQLSKLLDLADDKKLQEVQACLEENRDPMVKILGQSFLSKLERPDSPPEEDDSALESDVRVKLFILLRNTDNQILNKLLGGIMEEMKLDLTAVKKEVELLKQFCTEGEKKLLKSLKYTSDFEFSNGCRAPLWRQALGEMCYLVIEPCDAETLFITCSSAGVFLNAGFKQEGDENFYERKSDFYEDLVTLLKSRSPHFAENINKQVFVEQEPPSAQRIQRVKLVDEEQGQAQKFEEQQKNNVDDWKSLRRALYSRKKLETFKSVVHANIKLNLNQEKQFFLLAAPAVQLSPNFNLPMKTSAGAAFGEDFSESSTDSEEEEEQTERRSDTNIELASEYWQIQKLVKYLKASDQTATVLILCAMMDLNLTKETCQLAIQDLGVLEILLNLLDTEDIRCKIASLKILVKISQNVHLRQSIVHMRGLQRMVNNLYTPVKELQGLAAETIANVAKFSSARQTVRRHGGIKILVKLLDCFSNSANPRANKEKDLEVARCGASALWSCSKSTKNKEAIRRAGGIPLLGRLLRSSDEHMLIPVVGTLQECASQETYRIAIQTEGMMEELVKNLRRDNDELQMLCASAIFKCAEDKMTRDLVRSYKGLQPLVSLLTKADNKQLLAAATGAIWKCSISTKNVAMDSQPAIISIPEEKLPVYRASACGSGSPLTGLHCAHALSSGTASQGPYTAPAPYPSSLLLVGEENTTDPREMVLPLVGGLELIVHLLKSTNKEVLTNICAVVAKLAKDQEILGILTDHGAVPLLAGLTNTTDDRLRCYLTEAIGHCCMWSTNRASFGKFGAVVPLVRYLESKDRSVLLNTAMALYQLSKDPNNIITMHKKGVVQEGRGDSFLHIPFELERSRGRDLRTERPKMNTIVLNKLSSQVLFEEKAKEVEMSSRNYLEVIDGQHPDLLCSSPAIRDSQAVRHRRSGGRPSGSKVRHKRQALQDMARPLKQWLYKHRDNPYPTKTEKILLALGSQMTLVQVSNWFANARRRLKNTVRQPDLSWALRIKLYNKYVQGNAERLSVSSEDSCSRDGDNPQRTQSGPEDLTKPLYQSVIKKEGSPMVGVAIGMDPGLRSAVEAASLAEDYVSPPKYKSSLLHRYLNDSLRHVMVANAVMDARKRNHSGSFSSNEYDDELLSPSSSEAEANFVCRAEPTDHGSSKHDNRLGSGGVAATQKEKVKAKDETYWKEINAAMALTNLAQGKDSVSGTTSCIIQKSSHIAEVKTVKVLAAEVLAPVLFVYAKQPTFLSVNLMESKTPL